MLRLKPDEQFFAQCEIICFDELGELIDRAFEGVRKRGRCQPFAPPLGTEAGAFELGVSCRPASCFREGVLGKQAHYAAKERRFTSGAERRGPIIAKLDKETKERPFKEDVVCERYVRAAALEAQDVINLKRGEMVDRAGLEVAGCDPLAKVTYALFSNIDESALPLRDGLGHGVVPGPLPPRVDQVDFGLWIGVVR